MKMAPMTDRAVPPKMSNTREMMSNVPIQPKLMKLRRPLSRAMTDSAKLGMLPQKSNTIPESRKRKFRICLFCTIIFSFYVILQVSFRVSFPPIFVEQSCVS